tara:strand:+ start:3135 stop:3557 length:423 start_codon:yes stop_codon:yes gene_type:complete
MRTEKDFNAWIRRSFYETTNGNCVVQRIENTTSNGVPDLLVITSDVVFLIESKFETVKIRSEQAAFQIKVNEVTKGLNSSCICITLTGYPKTKRLVVNLFDKSVVTKEGVKCKNQFMFTLDQEGFKEFYNYFIYTPNASP